MQIFNPKNPKVRRLLSFVGVWRCILQEPHRSPRLISICMENREEYGNELKNVNYVSFFCIIFYPLIVSWSVEQPLRPF